MMIIERYLEESRKIRDIIREYTELDLLNYEEKEKVTFDILTRVKSLKAMIDYDIKNIPRDSLVCHRVKAALKACEYILEGTDIAYYSYITRSIDGLISNIVFDLESQSITQIKLDAIRSHLDNINRIIKYLIEIKVNSYEDIFTLGPEIVFRFQDLSRNLEDVDIKLGLPSNNEYANRCERARAYIERVVFPQLEQDSALTLKINGFALQINNFINGGAFLYI